MRHILPCLLILVLADVAVAQHVHTNRTGTKKLPRPKEDGVWHFVVFGDRTGGPAEGITVLQQAVRDANLLDPDIVMTVGDLINGYNETPEWMAQMREYHSVMSKLSMPWYPVAGNHDTFWRRTKGEEERPELEHDQHYETHFGPLWYWFAHKTAAFIVLYTDETDPVFGRKHYGVPGGQRMSAEQKQWLSATLKKTSGFEHVFVFVHHPRWIKNRYPHSDWQDVERRLLDAGNVTAVFAGHIHRLHYAEARRPSGGRPIQYFTLATTGANSRATQLSEPGYSHSESLLGYVHHLDVVTVRGTGRISVSTLPIGAVMDPKAVTQELKADVAALEDRPASYDGTPIVLSADGSATGTLRLTLRNPAKHAVEFTLTPDAKGSGFALSPDHAHLTVPPGGNRDIGFRYERGPRGMGRFQAPVFTEVADWLGDGLRISTRQRTHAIAFDIASETLPVVTQAGVLHLDGRSCVRVESAVASLPQGALTVEGWVCADDLSGRRPFVTKTESSEYGLFLNDGRPLFDVFLGDAYVKVRAPSSARLQTGRWHHVAGVYDGKVARLFIDGKMVATAPGQGRRKTNNHPLFIGADPDRSGQPVDHLTGRVDAVRVSSTARYKDNFQPGRTFTADEHTALQLDLDYEAGPVTPDSGPSGAHGLCVGNAWCGPDKPTRR